MTTTGSKATRLTAKTVLLGSAASLLLLAAPPAWAQNAPPATDTGASTEDNASDVVVTGSRIPRPEVDTLQPTIVTTATQVENTGFVNLGNVLRQSPLFGAFSQQTGDAAQGNSQRSTSDGGTTFIDLYGLGPQRTLTLINSHRVVGSASANGGGANGLQVDISAIPTGLVERIETVSVGGAPIYGSDAIAGTVNIILKDNFQGLSLDAQTGLTFRNADAGNYRLQVLAGHNFAGGRGNITLAGAFTQTNRVSAADRGFPIPTVLSDPNDPSKVVPFQGSPYFAFTSGNGRPSNYFGFGGFDANGNPGGFYTQGGKAVTFDRQGNLIPFTAVGVTAAANLAGVPVYLISQLPTGDTDTTRDVSDLISPSKRYFALASARFDVTPGIQFWARGSYSKTKAEFYAITSTQDGNGSTAATQPLLVDPYVNPFLNPAARSYFINNPGPYGAYLPSFYPGYSTASFWLNRDFRDATDGGRSRVNQDIWTAQAGLKGDFHIGDRKFHWDITGSYGRSDRTITARQVVTSRLLLAEDAVYSNGALSTVLPTPQNLSLSNFTYDAAAHLYRENGTGNVITCRARVAGQAPAGASAADVSGCAPFNPFGQQNPADVLSYVSAASTQRSINTQQYIEANIGGDVVRLPAGMAQASIGAQIRREDGSFALDTLSASGQFLGGGTGQGVAGHFISKEVYGEVSVPLLNHDMVSVIENLTFEGAARLMDSSVSGSNTTWTAGGRLELLRGLTFRGNRTRSVRQPAIAELFSGVVPARQSINDPCSTAFIGGGANPSVRRQNCIAQVIANGNAADAASAATFLASYAPPLAGITGTNSGNPNLRSEVADSWTVGVILQPRFLPKFTLSADYLRIKIKGAIAFIDATGLVNACVDTTDASRNVYCANFTRGSNFRVSSFNAFQDNIGLIDFSGVSAQMRYGPVSLGKAGALSFDSTVLYNDHYRTTLNGNTTDQVGAVGTERWRVGAGMGYAIGPFDAYLHETYYAPAKLGVPANTSPFKFNDVPAYWLTDLTLNLRIQQRMKLQLTINNLFDVSPAFNTFSYQYDRIGRRFVVGASVKF